MKSYNLIAAGLLLTASVFAQAPQKMSYQARSSNSELIISSSVGMKISICKEMQQVHSSVWKSKHQKPMLMVWLV
jgi:hypothetical protein